METRFLKGTGEQDPIVWRIVEVEQELRSRLDRIRNDMRGVTRVPENERSRYYAILLSLRHGLKSVDALIGHG